MEEIRRRGMGKGPEPHALSRVPFSQNCPVLSTRKLSKASPFGFFWRLHYAGMIDQITGHWRLIPPPAPLPSLDVRVRTESSNPPIT